MQDFFASVFSGPLGVISGAFIGVLASAAFEEYLSQRRQGAARRLRRLRGRIWRAVFGNPTPVQAELFSLGNRTTPMMIVEGDGSQVLDAQRVSVVVDHEFATPPEELQEWVDEITQEQAERAARGDQGFWNGPNYAVKGLTISRTLDEEQPDVCLRLMQSDYFTFLATQQLDRRFRDGSTPRTRYLEERRPEDVPVFMSCSFGTNVALVTADDQLVVARRSERVGSRPGVWSSSANEALSRGLDSDGRSSPDLYRVMRRGVDEELSIHASEYRLDMLAFTIDTEVHQWGGLFVGYLHGIQGNDVLSRRSRGVPDKWEHDELQLLPFQPGPVLQFVRDQLDDGNITPTAGVLFYLALVHRHGRHPIERWVRKIFAN